MKHTFCYQLFQLAIGILVIGHSLTIHAQLSEGEAIARRLYDPLSDLRGVATSNDIFFDVNDGANTLRFDVQPVWALHFAEPKFLVIPRLTIPYREGVRFVTNDASTVWGLSDITLDVFIAPSSLGGWKWGFGPQFSFETSEAPELKEIGNGLGFSGVISGSITEELTVALVAGNTWSYDGTESVATLDPFFVYYFPFAPGMYIGYFQSTTIDWKRTGNRVTFPVGAAVGGAFPLGQKGYGLDLNVGGYTIPLRTNAAPTSILTIGISLVFPE